MKILVADDHPLVRRALRLSLSHMRPDATIFEAASLAAALDCLTAHPDVDLTLLDLSMPDTEDMEGLARVLGTAPGVPVAVVSADEGVSTALRALAAGASGYLPKSLPEDILRAAIGLILAGGIYVPPLVAEAAGTVPPHAHDRDQPDARAGSALHTGHRTDRKPTGQDGNGTAASLTQRQSEVLDLVIEGLSNREIAERLQLAEATVKVHMTAILRAYGVNNRTKAIGAAQRERAAGARRASDPPDTPIPPRAP